MNGKPTTIDTGDGTLDGLVSALNAGGTGVTASKIKIDNNGNFRLLVTANQTGAANTFTLAGASLLGGTATNTAGQDAKITLGIDTISSATNTFTGVLPGVDVTVSAAAVGTTVQVDVSQDSSSMQDAVKSLVDNVNATLTQLDSLTAYDPTTKTSGPLVGDNSVQSLRAALLDTIYPPDGSSMAGVGIQTDRYGKLVFDPTAFATAYAADPAKVAGAFTTGSSAGLAARVATVATNASDPYTGTVTASIAGWNSSIKRVTDDIADWDTRLALRQTTLQQQFTALETAMNQMNSQSSWLAGQIASLPTSSSSK
jgi:flagellar hook-associated protein 2